MRKIADDKKALQTISHLFAFGHTKTFIARAIGTSQKSLSNMIKKYPEVKAAFEVDKIEMLNDVRANMFRIAMEGKDNDAIAAGFKLLEKYDTNTFIDTEVVDDTSIQEAILLELK